jgi:hypothetical protein
MKVTFAGMEQINQRLAKIILQREAELLQHKVSRPFPQSWNSFSQLHGEQDLLSWDYDEVRTLASIIRDSSMEYLRSLHLPELPQTVAVEPSQQASQATPQISKIVAWANVSRKADWHGLHSHYAGGPETASGVYWVQTPAPPASEESNELNGHTIYYDPRGYFHPGRTKKVFAPQAGTLLLHPAWLPHAVAPVKEECVRISIAFDVHANFIIS